MGFPKDRTLTSKSMSIFESPAEEGSGATESQELVPETKLFGLQEEGAYKRKHLTHKLKHCMHIIQAKHINRMNITKNCCASLPLYKSLNLFTYSLLN